MPDFTLGWDLILDLFARPQQSQHKLLPTAKHATVNKNQRMQVKQICACLTKRRPLWKMWVNRIPSARPNWQL